MSIVEDVGGGALLGTVCVASGAYWVSLARDGLRRYEAEHRAHDRARQAQAAVTEASLEADWFAPEAIHATVVEILEVAAALWEDDQLEAATPRQDRAYIERWARSIAAGMGTGVRLASEPTFDVLGITNRPGESEDRIVLRVRLRLVCAHPAPHAPRVRRADLRWTLGRRNHAWTLLSIDADPLADPLLDGQLTPARWADDERLEEESLIELAGESAGGPVDLSQLVVTGMPAPQQLLELAQLDGRFDPSLLEARIRHIVGAWEEASTGAIEPLAAVASPEGAGELLYPGSEGRSPSCRWVLRDAVIDAWAASELRIVAVPYRVTIDLLLSAIGYLVDWPSGTYRAGNPARRRQMRLSWTLELSDATPAGWQLVASSDPSLD